VFFFFFWFLKKFIEPIKLNAPHERHAIFPA